MNAAESETSYLKGPTRRLEALERENAELRGKVAALEGPYGRREEAAAGQGGGCRCWPRGGGGAHPA